MKCYAKESKIDLQKENIKILISIQSVFSPQSLVYSVNQIVIAFISYVFMEKQANHFSI